MNDYSIEMCYGFGVSLSVEAKNTKEAIEKAKEIVKSQVVIDEGMISCGDIEFEQVTFINKR